MTDKPTVEIVLYYANWCGYCKKFKGDPGTDTMNKYKFAENSKWGELVKIANNKGFKTFQYEDSELESKGDNIKAIHKRDIKSWPTILIFINGQEPHEYKGSTGEPTIVDDILKYIDEKIKTIQKGGNLRWGNINYLKKYTKYKLKYLNLLNKYNKN